jgi:hypothetical protein
VVELLAYVALGVIDVHRSLWVVFNGDQVLLYFHVRDVQWEPFFAKKMVLPGILYAMYWMILRAGDVWILLESGNGKLRASVGSALLGEFAG